MNPTYLICYDIRNPKRLTRLHRMLRRYALALQYSVFAATLGNQDLERLVAAIREKIDRRQDDVRLYLAPRNCLVTFAGRSPLNSHHILFGAQLTPLLRKNPVPVSGDHGNPSDELPAVQGNLI